jgi:hypothetical protein
MKLRDIILNTVANTEALLVNKTKKTMRWISNRSFLSLEIMFSIPFNKIKRINTVWSKMLEYVDFETLYNQ